MRITVSADPLLPWQVIADYAAKSVEPKFGGAIGAVATFVGTMRDFNADNSVHSMRLEHYPGMTELELQRIADSMFREWRLLDMLIHHRVGEIFPQQAIVTVAVWASHRRDAFAACRATMEALKSRAPFWKCEHTPHGARWVEQNTPG
jgi:molybdopterin synthase catalytic subunit